MTTKKTILITFGALITIAIIALALISLNDQEPLSKCGDGICDVKEQANPKLCPKDCKATAIKTCSQLGGTICPSLQTCSGSWLDASDSDRCCSGECGDLIVDYEDSPFGFHPGNANNYTYIQDLGAAWSREWTYITWDWVDVNRDGLFKFTDATAPPKPGHPGEQINYDAQRLDVPENINIVKNVCPFRNGGNFANSQEKDIYYDFVKAMVERYDGDNDLGCTQISPDCYNLGDKEYPSQELIDKSQTNPIKYWQVCNKVTDACDGRDCKKTYAKKYAEAQKITYQAVKEADSSAYVLIAGDSQQKLYPEVFQHLNGHYIDIIDKHSFGMENPHGPKKSFESLKNSLQASGFDLSKLRFWITETGTYSGDPINVKGGVDENPYQSEKQQARGLLKRYVLDLSFGIEKIFWAWNIVEGFSRDCGIFDYTGLVYDGCDCNEYGQYVCEKGIGYDLGQGVKKLGYYTYKLMVEKLEGSNWDNIQTIQESDNIYIYKFINKETNIPTWVAWNDNAQEQTITLNVGDIGSVKITEAVPDAESGVDLDKSDYPNFFKTETKTVSKKGTVALTLGENPIFVEEK